MKRALSLALGATVVVVAALGLRMLLGARAELARADAAKSDAARVRHLRRAMAYYVPASPYVRVAKARLVALARAAEAAGQSAAALEIWRELRSAIVRLRWLAQPFGPALALCAERIAALSARAPNAATALRTRRGQAALHARLAAPPAPSLPLTALGLAGFIAFAGGGFLLIARGLTADARIVRRPFIAHLAIVGLGFVCFCLGMAYA